MKVRLGRNTYVCVCVCVCVCACVGDGGVRPGEHGYCMVVISRMVAIKEREGEGGRGGDRGREI